MELPIGESPQYIHLVTWGFYGMMSFIGWLGVSKLGQLEKSVSQLNERVAVVIERVDTHEKRLDKHDFMFDGLEKQN